MFQGEGHLGHGEEEACYPTLLYTARTHLMGQDTQTGDSVGIVSREGRGTRAIGRDIWDKEGRCSAQRMSTGI